MNTKSLICSLFISIVLPCLANQQDALQEFFQYAKVEQQLDSMLKQQSTHQYSERSIRGVIEMCQDSHLRGESIRYLKTKGLYPFKDNQFLIIERGGGGLACQALYLPLRQHNLAYFFYYIYDGNYFNLKLENKRCDKDSLPTIDSIIKMMNDGYQGDISRTGLGLQTIIATLIDNGVETKRVIIRGQVLNREAAESSLEFKEFFTAIMDIYKLYQVPIAGGS